MKKAKIATCCHCGARTVLDVAHLKRVRLDCESCGAPITRLAPLRPEDRAAPRAEVERRAAPVPHERKYDKRRTHWKRKKRKSLLWEVLDEIEDLFD
jgi:transposase